MNYGFVKVASAIPQVKVADCTHNSKEIKSMIFQAEKAHVELLVFPELSITGCTCGELFKQRTLLDNAKKALLTIVDKTRECDVISIVGLPYEYRNMVFNMAAVIHRGKIKNFLPKSNLSPQEKNWFMGGECLGDEFYRIERSEEIRYACINKPVVFSTPNFKFAVEFQDEFTNILPTSPLKSLYGADIIACMGANTEYIGHHSYVKQLMQVHSNRCTCAYVYASSGYGESTTDGVYGGSALIYENGELLQENERFQMEPQLIITEIDVEKLRNRKLKNSYFLRPYCHDLTKHLED